MSKQINSKVNLFREIAFNIQKIVLIPVVILLALNLPGTMATGIAAETTRTGNIHITIPDYVKISQPFIYLGDIATIAGAKNQRLQDLQQLELGKAPQPGYRRILNRQLIKLVLLDKGFYEEDYQLDMSDQVTIELKSQTLEPDQVIQYIKETIYKHLTYNQDKILIKVMSQPPVVEMPAGDYQLKINSAADEDFLGNYSLPVSIIIDGETWKTIYVGLQVAVKEHVFVASRSIISGKPPVKSDFKEEEKEITNVRGSLITSWNQIEDNSIIKIPLGKGEILTTYYLKQIEEQEKVKTQTNKKETKAKKPYLINWGDQVQAEVIVGSITITTTVKSRGRGREGDFILVENIETGYQFRARVINSHLVRVESE